MTHPLPRPPSALVAARLDAPRPGARVTVAGLVLLRQRPGTAQGVVFVTLEDETGVVNVVIWRKVFEGQADRLSVVVATHTGWPGLEEPMLQAPLALDNGQLSTPPVEQFDGYAVTGYFGFDLGSEDMADTLLGWIAASRAVAQAKAAETGADPDTYLAAHEFDLAYDLAAEALRQGSLGELLRDIFPYHADLAARHDLQLMMYEGGTHVVGHGATVENETLTGFFNGFNYSPQMARIYEELIAGWHAAGGTAFR